MTETWLWCATSIEFLLYVGMHGIPRLGPKALAHGIPRFGPMRPEVNPETWASNPNLCIETITTNSKHEYASSKQSEKDIESTRPLVQFVLKGSILISPRGASMLPDFNKTTYKYVKNQHDRIYI